MENRFRIKRKENRRKGFTLVELCVVLAMMAILAGVAVWGILGWRDWTDFKRQNEYAQTLFVAAQNQLTEYSTSGELDLIQTELTDASGNYYHAFTKSMNGTGVLSVNNVTLLNGEGVAYDLTKLWPESSKDTTKDKSQLYQGNICYLIGTAEKYEAYLDGKLDDSKSEDVETRVLYDMLSSYVYDTSILRATICVEFTPEDGQVFAVLYSDKDSGFVYDNTNDAKRGTVDISNRTQKVRKQKMIGYYGVDTLSKATSRKTQKPVISNVKLNNVETLNLSWKLSKVTSALQELTYEITVKDKDSSKNGNVDLMKIVLDGTKVKNQASGEAIPCDVTIYSYDADNKRTEKTFTGDDAFKFHVWVDAGVEEGSKGATSGTIHLVLDGADLSATSAAYLKNMAGNTGLKETTSFHRFNLDAENIYCMIKGSGSLYKTTAGKESNTENAYFGSVDTKSPGLGTDKVKYTLENARHLYNVRYLEDATDDEWKDVDQAVLHKDQEITYSVSKNIDWQTFVAGQYLYDQNEIVISSENQTVDFPSILKLNKDHTFTSTDKSRVAVQNLQISFDSNKALYACSFVKSLGSNGENIYPTGLFMVNYGTIKDVSLDNISVTGHEYVAAFCGLNASSGQLENLQVLNSKDRSVISGEKYVGGIAGKQGELSQAEQVDYALTRAKTTEKELQINYTDLLNRGKVTGTECVGGIIGEITAYEKTYKVTENGTPVDLKVTVKVNAEKCENYGQVEATPFGENGTTYTTARYIGGITGYSHNQLNDNKSLVIQNCKSSPQYTSDRVESILKNLSDDDMQNSKLNGVYVGGIVGYNDGGLIQACNTIAEGKKQGYVFGYQYVGGIVGLNVGSAQGSVEGGTSVKAGINEANVIGATYVGGITGCNAQMQEATASDEILKPDESRDQENAKIVKNWTNKGAVVSTGDYVGGITGYNTGDILDCNSDVDPANASNVVNATSMHGDYVGGIAGYNNGVLQSEKHDRLSSEVYITGRNYVGGIVGYNEKDAVVLDYDLSGGYIRATGDFIGGYAGINASERLLVDTVGNKDVHLNANPNEVTGRYCVGGAIGGNIVDFSRDVTTNFNTDNFLGKIAGDAFVGGFIGYNGCGDGITPEQIEQVLSGNSDLTSIVNGLNEKTVSSKYTFRINGEKNQSNSKIDAITAKIYVGGVIGYNADGSKLYISNVVNKTRIIATEAIQNAEEQRNRSNPDKYLYSYAGGVIGKVGTTVTIDNCKNQDVGEVFAEKATYHGAICEINEGRVINCAVSSIGSNGMNYVGGIAGLNKNTGKIIQTVFEKQTVAGSDYIGGIAAENFGLIKDTTINNGTVSGFGNYVGGLVGANYAFEKGTGIYLGHDIQVAVSSVGDAVGGLVGSNAGIISANAEGETTQTTCKVSGNVQGSHNVGGIIGVNDTSQNESLIIKDFYNMATVTAVKGSAGGVVGESNGGTIQDCLNRGNVISNGEKADQPKAGGIVAYNKGLIVACGNDGEINAANGNCGGISASNAGTIRACSVMPQDAESGKWWQQLGFGKTQLVFTALDNVGGITGVNEVGGIIKESYVTNLKVTDTVKSYSSNVGAIAGDNKGTIKLSDQAVRTCSVGSYTTGSNVGGVCGRNTGSIAGENNAVIQVDQIGFEGKKAVYANLGGVTGQNFGSIAGCSVIADIIGYMGSNDSGYGGVAGINIGRIEGCSYDGNLVADGAANAIVSIGGITGINYANGFVTGCKIGVSEENTQISSGYTNKTSAFGYVGGMIGQNMGTIQSCDNYDEANNNSVFVHGYAGHLGGIVGYQYASAVVTGTEDKPLSTGKNWKVVADFYSNDCGTGGIMGYSASGRNISYVYNHANVSANYPGADNLTAGGFIGRLENKENNEFTINHCANYGTIEGNNQARVGGIIGREKYKGCIISNTDNYGTINAIKNGYGSGILADVYTLDANSEVILMSCKNFGNVTGQAKAAGIFANTDSANNAKVFITDCVNEGVIQSATVNQAGIMPTPSGIQLYVSRCRNYGNSQDSNGNYAGIVGGAFKEITDSFTVDASQKLTNANGTIKRSYYLSDNDKKVETLDGVYLDKIYWMDTQNAITEFTQAEKDKYKNGTIISRDFKPYNNVTLGSIRYDFWKTAKGYPQLQSFGIYWAGDTNKQLRQYKFTVECLDASNKRYYLNEAGNWVPSKSEAYEFTSFGKGQNDTTSNVGWWTTNFDPKQIQTIIVQVNEVRSVTWDNAKKVIAPGTVNTTVAFYGMSASEQRLESAVSDTLATQLSEIAETQAKIDEYNKNLGDKDFSSTNDQDWVITSPDLKVVADNNNPPKMVFENVSNLDTDIYKDKDARNSWKRSVWNGSSAKLPFILELTPGDGPKSVKHLSLLWAGNNDTDAGATARRYEYNLYMYDENGKVLKSFLNQIGDGYQQRANYDDSKWLTYDDELQKLPTGTKVSRIRIEVTKILSSGKASYNSGTWSISDAWPSTSTYICMWGIQINSNTEVSADDLKMINDRREAIAYLATLKAELANSIYENLLSSTGKNIDFYPGAIQSGAEAKYGSEMVQDPAKETADSTYSLCDNTNNGRVMIPDLQQNVKSLWEDRTATYSFDDSAKGNRQKVYEELDPKIIQYYKDLSNAVPVPPKNLAISSTGSSLKVTWTAGDDKYYAHEVVYQILDKDGNEVANNFDQPETLAYGISEYIWDKEAEYAGKGYQLQFYVRSVYGIYDRNNYTNDAFGPMSYSVQEGASAWVASQKNEIYAVQVAPQVHMELAAVDKFGKTSPDTFVVVLENASAYQNKETTIKVSLSTNMNVYKEDGSTTSTRDITFTAKDGRSARFSLLDYSNNANLTALALSDATHFQSVSTTRQSAVYGIKNLQDSNYYAATFDGFFGNSIDDIYNSISMQKAAGASFTEMYINSELILDQSFTVDNGSVKLPVVVSNGNSHVTMKGGILVSNLSRLPKDILETEGTITVRTYPWRSQSNVTWYGYDVKDKITEAELQEALENAGTDAVWTDSERVLDGKETAIFTITNGEVALEKGYILRKNMDETYSIIYSSILANDDLYAKNQVKEKIYKIQPATTEQKGSVDSIPIKEVPVIHDNMESSNVNNKDFYAFSWNVKNPQTNDQFELQLTGTTKDGKEVLIRVVNVDATTQDDMGNTCDQGKGDWKYAFADKDANWNYSNLNLKVTRLGTTKANGAASAFPSSADKDFAVKLRFSTITIPTVTLQRENGQDAEKNSLEYDVAWNSVPKEEYDSGDLAGYEITISRSLDDTAATISGMTETQKAEELSRLQTLYQGKAGENYTEDLPNGVYTYQWTEIYKDHEVEKCMILTVTQDDTTHTWSISKDLTSVWKISKEDTYEPSLKMPVDLNDYERGELLQISVRATATETAVTYQSGNRGVIREMTLPSRLEVPLLKDASGKGDTAVSVVPNYDEADYMTISEMNKDGIQVNITSESGQLKGKYQIAAAIYDKPSDNLADKTKVAAGDGNWNADALVTVFSKADETTLSGNFTSGNITIQASDLQTSANPDIQLSDYAGKWLKIAVRAVSDSNISSWWTDEDDADLSLNYIWLQIPRAQTDTPVITQAKDRLFYDVDTKQWDSNGSDTVSYIGITQTTLVFEEQSYADYYQIQTVHASLEDELVTGNTIYYVDWIYALKTDTGFHIFYETSDPSFNQFDQYKHQNEEGNPENPIAENSYYLGQLTTDQVVMIPYKGTINVTLSKNTTLDTISYLKLTKDGFTYCLPDTEQIDTDLVDGSEYKFTSQVTVQTGILTDHQDCYENSQYSDWYYADIDGSTAVKTIEKVLPALETYSINGESVTASMSDEVAYRYTMTGDHWYLFKVMVKDQSGNVVDTRLISAYGNGVAGSTIRNELRLYHSIYNTYATGAYRISVQIAAIGYAGEGIGEWSKASSSMSLSKLEDGSGTSTAQFDEEDNLQSAEEQTQMKPIEKDDQSLVDDVSTDNKQDAETAADLKNDSESGSKTDHTTSE